jgi:neutral amino acid transport system permease protein
MAVRENAGALEGIPERPRRAGGQSARAVTVVLLGAAAVALASAEGLQALGQTTVNGVVSGTYLALGAAGLTLVYGVLRLVNFAHGDMLTLAAYTALLAQGLGAPFVVSVLAAVVGTAVFAFSLERVMWHPMRKRGAGLFQLFLMSLGLAFLLRYAIQFVAGTNAQDLNVDVVNAHGFIGLRIGYTQLWIIGVGLAVLIGFGVFLTVTSVGRQIRALADDHELAETSGINSSRIILITWLVAGGLAGLAGVFFGASLGIVTPEFGHAAILSLFAAVIVGGIGNPFGALAGGLFIGLIQEWSTLLVNPGWKTAVGFAAMIAVLLLRPQGLLGQAPSTES